MSHPLISRNADLRRLQDGGFEVGIVNSHLVISGVPYVNHAMEVRSGVLISDLTLAGDQTLPPTNHVAYFMGEEPCDSAGRPLTKLLLTGQPPYPVSPDLVAQHWFSSKPVPPARYENYYEKMTTYAAALSGHAEVINPSATARTFRLVESSDNDVFRYHDTASSRAGISALAEKLRVGSVAIVGAGGTGAYILDFLAKTPAAEIHLFDGDTFLQHNAFRSPGAAHEEELAAQMSKVEYLANRYSPMRRGIIPHAESIDQGNMSQLVDMSFVFLAIDSGPAKAPIMRYLEDHHIPFVDVGMGLYLAEDKVGGVIRTTFSSDESQSRAHARARISTGEAGPAEYNTNIQIAELNALNAAFAVIQYKKHVGFYSDLRNEHFSAYVLDSNTVINEDSPGD